MIKIIYFSKYLFKIFFTVKILFSYSKLSLQISSISRKYYFNFKFNCFYLNTLMHVTHSKWSSHPTIPVHFDHFPKYKQIKWIKMDNPNGLTCFAENGQQCAFLNKKLKYIIQKKKVCVFIFSSSSFMCRNYEGNRIFFGIHLGFVCFIFRHILDKRIQKQFVLPHHILPF